MSALRIFFFIRFDETNLYRIQLENRSTVQNLNAAAIATDAPRITWVSFFNRIKLAVRWCHQSVVCQIHPQNMVMK